MKKKAIAKKKKVVSAKVKKKVNPAKKKLDGLKNKEKDIKKKLAAVTKEINTLERSLEKPKTTAKKSPARTKKATQQPSLTDMIIDIIKKKKRPLTIKEICTALIKEKKYKTRSNDFDHQIRVLMYKKQHGPFKKAGVGLFTVAKK